MTGGTARHDRGWAALTRVNGTEAPSVVERVAELAPAMARGIVEFAYGEHYARETLGDRERQLVTIGALAAMGGCEPQLRVHVNAALECGMTPDEVVEAIQHVVPFAGFPRAMNALHAARAVFERRGVWTSEAWRSESAAASD